MIVHINPRKTIYYDFNIEALKEILGLMTPSNCFYVLITKNNSERENLKLEKWFDTTYTIESLDSVEEGLLTELESPPSEGPDIGFCPKNPFAIFEEIKVCLAPEGSPQYPQLI